VWEKVTEALVLMQNVGEAIAHHGVKHCKGYADEAEHVFLGHEFRYVQSDFYAFKVLFKRIFLA